MTEPITTERILVEIAPGELLDKITILRIKQHNSSDEAALANVRRELEQLDEAARRALPPEDDLPQLVELTDELAAVNRQLWRIEDEIRDCEREGDFGPRFVELARDVYRTNDRRANLKRQINDLLGARIVEEKMYANYAR